LCEMATEALCLDTYYRMAPPPLHYVSSADDVIGRGGSGVSSQRQHDRDLHCATRTHRGLTMHAAAASMVSACRRKLSVDDGRWCPGQQVTAVRRRPMPGGSGSGTTADSDWTYVQRRRSSASSPPGPTPSTLSRTMSEHTLDRGPGTTTQYFRGAECRDDLLDDWTSVVTAPDQLDETFMSPPRIAPVSGQLSLVCVCTSLVSSHLI